MTKDQNDIEHAQQLTAANLLRVLQQNNDQLTQMNLQDVTELANDVARMVPAGNVVTMVFSQLSSIKGKQVSGNETRQMMSLLKQGMSTFMDKAAYLTFYTTPAILISGYQNLLEAAGKDPNSAFPNGTWQFYLEFGLREDTGRHACETIGMQEAIRREKLDVNEADRLTAWILASAWLIQNYDELLTQEWHERKLLNQLAEQIGEKRIDAQWVDRRPYGVPRGSKRDYLQHRKAAFTQFILENLSNRGRDKNPDETLQRWHQDETLLSESRQSYREQMTILTALEPEAFSDSHIPIPLDKAQVTIFWDGHYFLIPVLHNGMHLDVNTVRVLAQSILNSGPERQRMAVDEMLIHIPRVNQAEARASLLSETQEQLAKLRYAPIIINWDEASSDQSLAQIRQSRRGIGDHALTLFRTDKSMVFDQSHIFFDAIWGMAVSQILTNQATDYVREMNGQPGIKLPSLRPPSLNLVPDKDVSRNIRKMAVVSHEISAEMALDIMPTFHGLRNILKQRNKELSLTVNDLLILWRAMYNTYYRPHEKVIRALEIVRDDGNRNQHKAAIQALEALAEINNTAPAFLIPIDASAKDPKERIYPVTFRPQQPWTSIGPQHLETWHWLKQNELSSHPHEKQEAWDNFNEARTNYFEMLRMFVILMARYKEVALAGESMSTMTLKILASVPKRLQSWLSHIPDRIDLLNDMLKGTEVFSNVGKVAEDSSLTRFITAKDDNEKKVLCWGIMTRADDIMVITLRDFRPWVMDLKAAGVTEVAEMITEDFLVGYADGLYQFVKQLSEIVRVTGK